MLVFRFCIYLFCAYYGKNHRGGLFLEEGGYVTKMVMKCAIRTVQAIALEEQSGSGRVVGGPWQRKNGERRVKWFECRSKHGRKSWVGIFVF